MEEKVKGKYLEIKSTRLFQTVCKPKVIRNYFKFYGIYIFYFVV